MKTSSIKFQNLKVGLTIFIGLVLFFFFIFLVGTEANLFSKTYNLKIFVDNSQGVSEGSLVSLGGIKIGSVDDLSFNQHEGVYGIIITLSIKDEYKNRITKSSSASIKTKGLLGDKFVDISIGNPTETPLAENSFLPVQSSISLDKLAVKMEPALNDFSQLIHNLKLITDTISSGKGSLGKLIQSSKTADELESVVNNLSRFTNAIVNQKGSLGKLTYDETLYNNLNTLSNNLTAISDSIRNGKGSLGKFVMDNSIYESVNSISKRLDKIISKAEGDSSLIGGLVSDKKMYKNFSSLLMELNNLISDIKNNPDKYLHISVF